MVALISNEELDNTQGVSEGIVCMRWVQITSTIPVMKCPYIGLNLHSPVCTTFTQMAPFIALYEIHAREMSHTSTYDTYRDLSFPSSNADSFIFTGGKMLFVGSLVVLFLGKLGYGQYSRIASTRDIAQLWFYITDCCLSYLRSKPMWRRH